MKPVNERTTMKKAFTTLAILTALTITTFCMAADIKNESGDVVAQTLEDKTGVKSPVAKTPRTRRP